MSKLIKVAMIVAGVGAMLSFAGCGSAESKPEEVVLNVLKTMQSGKADQAFLAKYCEEDTAKLFAGFGAQMTEALKGATFAVVYANVDDDVAVVKIKQEGGQKPGESYYDAKKVDGRWKIQVNKEAHSDYQCISQKTISECVEAIKAAASKNGDVKYKERCAKEFWEEMQGMAAKASPEAFKEMHEALNGIKIKGHKKSVLHDGAIEVECEMPGKDGSVSHNSLILKMVDGKWIVLKID
ncbi:MAG: hypothetical protein IJG84_08190 [Kiritimatiellae bacterium]|nr:hypothetical protein [Kiritimatiellia bacterium]